MLIGINGFEAVVSRFGYDEKTGLPRRVGSGEYCFQLLRNLHKIDKKNNYIIYLPEKPTADLPKESENWRYKIIKPRKMWTLVGLSLEFLFGRTKPNVFLSPTHYLPMFCPRNSAISILDVSYLKFPELFKRSDLNQLKAWTKYSTRKSKMVLTISQASKDDIIKEYNVPQGKIVVTYPGVKKVSHQLTNMEEVKKKYGVEGNYILFVGTLQPRKNIVRLIEAFSRLDSDLKLVIVGKRGWKFEEILIAPKKFNIEEKVRFLESVPDEDLPAFYKNAECFVLPSLYEGFGLPVVEAMTYGCPVITSNISSLPEAGGDAVLYIDPLDVKDITDKIELILKDPKLKEKLVKKGYEQIKKFSWEKTAKETLGVLEELGAK